MENQRAWKFCARFPARLMWKLNPSDRQVVEALRGLGITDSQLVSSPVRVEEVAMPVTGKSAWDMDIAPRD